MASRPEIPAALDEDEEVELELSLGGWSYRQQATATAAAEEEDRIASDIDGVCDRDLQHKRAKVASDDQDFHCASASTSLSELAIPCIHSCYMVPQSTATEIENNLGLSFSLLSNNEGNAQLGGSDNEEHNDGNGPDATMEMDICTPTENIENTIVRMDLTDDLLHLVFSFLDQKDLCKAAATCKQWRAASTHEDFWKCLNFENTEITRRNFRAMCSRYRNATEVNLFGVPSSDDLIRDAMGYLWHLHTLTLGKGQLSDAFFHELMNCPALNSLRIYDANLGNGMQEISLSHDRLRNLQIVKCRVLRVSVRCPQLQTLSLKRTSMAHVSLTCPQLNELDLSACHKLSDAGIRLAAQSCPLLVALDMSSCSCVSDDTLHVISGTCPNLSVLDASNCPNISLESVRLHMLTELKLSSCEGITSASMASIAYSHLLEALQLDNCGLLTTVSLDLPHLKKISLVHCRKFAELNLRSPVLAYIKVSNCSALHRINIVSNELQKLVLQKQESLATLSLQCCQLLEVDLSDCESLANSICEVFSDGGGCPMLKSLSLDNCESLSVVRLNSSSLISLSLIGCRGMRTLELSCSNLQKVNLDGCDHLERASFSPVGLWSLNLGICPKLKILQIEAPFMSILELKGCGVLSQASINCPCLTSLDASFCRQLMDDSLCTIAASCPKIECLILSSCLSVGLDGLLSLNQLQHLTLLDLSYTFLIELKPVFETCSQLEILKLSACKYLTDSSLDALCKDGALPALRELDLSYSSIGQSAISDVISSCTNLVSLNLNGCANMFDLVWKPSKSNTSKKPVEISSPNSNSEYEPVRLLETLNCIGCPNIKKVLIESMGQCFRLSRLNLNLSTNLKEVDLTCSNLNSLNLSNCISLEILKLDCPRLTNLQLLACTMLDEEAVEAAVLRCTMLEALNVHSCPKINAVYLGRLRSACPSLKRIQSNIWA